MTSATDISLLTNTAVNIQRDLKYLPYAILSEVLGRLGFNLMPGVQNEDTITEFLRKSGIAKPYSQGTVEKGQVGKAMERKLKVELAYASIVDNIQNYKTTIVGPDQLLDKNKTKKHPWEIVMLTAIVRTFGEDIIDALFPASRDVADRSPMGLFDGVDTKIDQEIVTGAISVANGNLITGLGDIVKPTDNNDTNAYDQMLEFWRKADSRLRDVNTLLKCPNSFLDAYQSAFFNKYKMKPSEDAYGRLILDGTANKCKIVASSALGIGQRMELEIPGNVDFGMDSLGDDAFVQVRNPFEDPNDIQFWIQASYGVRIRSVNKKVFQVNDGIPIANALSGDYIS
jgi:hypothetical protein